MKPRTARKRAQKTKSHSQPDTVLTTLSAPVLGTRAVFMTKDEEVIDLPVVQFGVFEAPGSVQSIIGGLVSQPGGLQIAEAGLPLEEEDAELVGYWSSSEQGLDEFLADHGIEVEERGASDDLEEDEEDPDEDEAT